MTLLRLMLMLMPRGRPPKYDEELIPRHFALPSSLNKELVSSCRAAGVDQVKFVRQAIKNALKKGVDNAFPDPSEKTGLSAELRLAVVDALREQQKDALPVRLPPPDRELLDGIAKVIGYDESATLIEDVMRNLLHQPEQIQEIILGPAVRNLQAKLLAEGKADVAKAGSIAKARTTQKIKALKDKPLVQKEKVA